MNPSPSLQVETALLTCRTDTAVPLPQNRQFYPALDGLRACAVLMVFAQHYVLSPLPDLWQWGWAGVDVFFVLSGFLITGILFDTRGHENRFRNFYVRRTLRIFPLYYGVLVVIVCLTPLMHWKWNVTWTLWPVYMANFVRFIFIHRFVQADGMLEAIGSPLMFLHRPIWVFLGHFWSLSVEEQFYLAWPLVVFKVSDRVKLRNISLAIVIALPLLRCLCVMWVPSELLRNQFLYMFTPLRIDSLLIGGLLALLIRGPEKRFLRTVAPWIAGFCILVLMAAPFLAPRVFHFAYHSATTTPFMETFGFTCIDLLAACVIWFSLHAGSHLFRVLTYPPLRKLGQVSYGFYVFHDIPHGFYNSLALWVGGSNALAIATIPMLMGLSVTLILAALSYRYFETPFLRLKDRWAP